MCLTQPWSGEADPVGVAFALGAAACWAAYILLTQRVGDAVSGLGGLAISMPVAALVATLVAGPDVVDHLTPQLLLYGLGLAILLPVVPFALELVALRRLTAGAFGTLMALEPAIALVIGFLALGQVPDGLAVVGVALVVAAGVGAERSGSRTDVVVDAVGREDRTTVDVVAGGSDELEARGGDDHPVAGRSVLAEDRVDHVGVRLPQ